MKVLRLVGLVFLFTIQSCTSGLETIDRLDYLRNVYYGEMRQAMQNDYEKYEQITSELVKLNNQNPYSYYHRAKSLFLLGKNEEGMDAVKHYLRFSSFGIEMLKDDTTFVANISINEWSQLELLGKQKVSETLVEKAFEIHDRGFAAEGIAANLITRSFYVGSIRKGKIVEINEDGKVEEFISGEYGISKVLGLEVTPDGREIWACAQFYDPTNAAYKSGVFQFDIKHKALIHMYLPMDTLEHEFNDLTIVPGYGVFVTDSSKGGVYRIRENTMDEFIDTKHIALTNGITHSGSNLYIADMFWGIMHYDLANNREEWVQAHENISLTYVDGMTYYKGGLIVHQFHLNGVFYYHLSEGRVDFKKVLTVNHPLLKDHTTGDVLKGHYYFIANSDIDVLNEFGDKVSEERLSNPIILKLKLWK